jgi:hypothetical protein
MQIPKALPIPMRRASLLLWALQETDAKKAVETTRDLLDVASMKDKGERKQEQSGRAFKLHGSYDIYKERGRRMEDWVGRYPDCRADVRTYWQVQQVVSAQSLPRKRSMLVRNGLALCFCHAQSLLGAACGEHVLSMNSEEDHESSIAGD